MGHRSPDTSRSRLHLGGARADAQFNLKSDRGNHRDKRVKRKQIDLAAHEIGDAWLGDA